MPHAKLLPLGLGVLLLSLQACTGTAPVSPDSAAGTGGALLTAPAPDLVHTVSAGETLSAIARRYGVSTQRIASYNGLVDANRIMVGDRLLIPTVAGQSAPAVGAPAPATLAEAGMPEAGMPEAGMPEAGMPAAGMPAAGTPAAGTPAAGSLAAGPPEVTVTSAELPPATEMFVEEFVVVAAEVPAEVPALAPERTHVMASGETLSAVAARYGVSTRTLQDVNGISNPNRIRVGTKLRIPGPGPVPAASGGVVLSWPLRDFVLLVGLNGEGGNLHQGLDLKANKGAPVLAAADGTVVFAGRQQGYGHVVVVEHADGLRSLYAHNRENMVQNRQAVERGQFIATLGRSGDAMIDHLHFEVLAGGESIDPLPYLPPYVPPVNEADAAGGEAEGGVPGDGEAAASGEADSWGD